MKASIKHPVVRIVVIYILVGGIWIVVSDRVVRQFSASVEQAATLETIKGLGFVALTSILIFLLLWREFSARQRVEDDLRELNMGLESRIAERTRDLEDANRRLVELAKAQQRVIRDVSHALKTPLTSVNLRLELLERAPVERAPQYIAGIKEQAQVINAMVNSLLDLSRIEAEVDAPMEAVDLNATVETSIESHIGLAHDKGLALDFSPTRPLPQVAGRSEHLMTLVDNLLSNAIKYTDAGGISVRTVYSVEHDEAAVIVADTGSGIEPAEFPNLFKRFYRTSAAKESAVTGSGLGLGIVREIVDQHNGRVEVESTPGEGSTFTVWLPVMSEAGDNKGVLQDGGGGAVSNPILLS